MFLKKAQSSIKEGKFQTLRRINIANELFDSRALSYFSTAGITNFQEKYAVNNFILGLKAAGLYSRLSRLWLISPTSQAAALLDFITFTSMTAVNNPSFSTNGFSFDRSTNYLNTNYIANNDSNVLTTSLSAGIYLNEFAGITTGLRPMAVADSSGGNFLRFNVQAGFTMRFSFPGVSANGALSGSLFNGFIVGSRIAVDDNRMFYNGAQSGLTATITSGSLLSQDALFIGAENSASTPVAFAGCTAALAYVGQGFSTSDVATLASLVETYQQQLSRRPNSPANLGTSAIDSSNIFLSWNNSDARQTEVHVERADGIAISGFVEIASLAGNVSSYKDGSLPSSTTYSYRARVKGPTGFSAYSNMLVATTGA